MNTIALEKLNSILVNVKANKTLEDFNKQYVEKIKKERKAQGEETDVVIEIISFQPGEKPHLVKITLSKPLFKKNAGIPFYAFVKNADKGLVVLIDVITGSAKVIDASVILSETDAGDQFRIKGTTYALKDTVNGFKRYYPVSVAPRKPRQHLTPNSPVVDAALMEEKALQEAIMAAKVAEIDFLPNEEASYYIEEDELGFDD